MISEKEFSQPVSCLFQLAHIWQIHNAEMIWLSPVKAFSRHKKYLLLMKEIQGKLLVIHNIEFLSIDLRENVKCSPWFYCCNPWNISKCLVDIISLLINPSTRLDIFIHALIAAKSSLYDRLSRNVGAKPHGGKHIQAFDITFCLVLCTAEDHDKFSDVLVVQSLALGIDRYKEMIIELLKKVLKEDGIQIRGVYERSDAKVRRQEGMELVKGFIGSEFPTLVEIEENQVKYQVDVKDGQKTGFFLDQKYNRLAIQKLCKNAKVLDCFTHTGSFALNAGIAGASSVLGVDASALAVDQAAANARLNGLEDRVQFLCRDVFELLPELEEKKEKFDVVILDPPAFTKSRSSIKNAVKGYREINLRALKLVREGGFLATCSCSHFMDYELFTQTIGQAASPGSSNSVGSR